MTRIVVLISGRGSNMRSIVEACQSGKLAAEVVAVISNRPDAKGLAYAQQQHIDTHVLDHKMFSDRAHFDTELQTLIESLQPDFVALAGFMRILSKPLAHQFSGRMINIHPSLLPLYPGLNTHARVLEAGDSTHGATVHFVTAELDGGPVIAQAQIPVLPDDTEQTLADRVLLTEHELYVRALQLCVSGAARLINGECYFDAHKSTGAVDDDKIADKVADKAINGSADRAPNGHP